MEPAGDCRLSLRATLGSRAVPNTALFCERVAPSSESPDFEDSGSSTDAGDCPFCLQATRIGLRAVPNAVLPLNTRILCVKGCVRSRVLKPSPTPVGLGNGFYYLMNTFFQIFSLFFLFSLIHLDVYHASHIRKSSFALILILSLIFLVFKSFKL
jgi:hypothetical protein